MKFARKVARKLWKAAQNTILVATIGHKQSCAIGKSIVAAPGVGCTQTFITVGAFDTQAEAQACRKYINTKFVQGMLSILKCTQHNARETWAKVPMQDFTSTSDLDWNTSLEELDRQLYRKYNLTTAEIAFLEGNFKYKEENL